MISLSSVVADVFSLCFLTVNKHKPWIETTYHGIVTENDDKVILDPPLIALDKDAPLRYAGERESLTLLPLVRQLMANLAVEITFRSSNERESSITV